MSGTANTATTRLGRGPAIALLLSLALHIAGVVWMQHWSALPDTGLELVLPNEVEFGVYDPAPAQPESKPIAPAAAPPVATQEPAAQTGTAAPKPTPKRSSAPPAPPSMLAQAGVMSTFAPRGAQVALRLDLDRLRASSLANEAGELLANLRDVRLLLDGSGVDPLRDLTHLFLASPDLRREHVVMAGRYHGDESVPRTAVDSLAQEHGEVASWRDLRGIRVAPWFNRDATARVLALIGPSLFAITREEDLGRVLAVARTLAKRSQRTAAQDDPVQALLNLEKQELMAISVENARTFIQGASAQQIGDRIEISVKQSGNDRFELHLTADYAGANDAKTAEAFWQRVKERYANHPLTALIGMADVLRDASLTAHDSSLVGTLSVSSAQARLILRFARDALGAPKLAPMPRADQQPPPLH